ncbi:MAG TPA: serine hydrolase domain-containing protein, partial [Tepidiformaceae bacterium]|nr:serine hydrolase domain-containing protein [Tepidiformaceae bacterium]
KRAITVSHLLAHQAGLHAFPVPFSLETLTDWDGGIRWVESLEPAWEPGTATGYHAVTWGWLVGGLVQQVTGRHIRDLIAEEIAGPLGVAREVFTGLPADIPLDDTAMLRIHVAGEGQPIPAESDFYRALPRDLWQHSNDEAFRRNPLPSISGHATAGALARMYALLAEGGELDGVRLCDSSDIARMSALVTADRDRVLGGRIPKATGFMLGGPGAYGAMPPRVTAFGHAGAGGSIAFADPERHLAVAILVNNMGYWPAGKGPIQALVNAVLAAFE